MNNLLKTYGLTSKSPRYQIAQKLQSITLIISHQDLNSYLPISQRLELG